MPLFVVFLIQFVNSIIYLFFQIKMFKLICKLNSFFLAK